MGMPRTSSITKSGRPESVAPRAGSLRDIRRIHHRQGQEVASFMATTLRKGGASQTNRPKPLITKVPMAGLEPARPFPVRGF